MSDFELAIGKAAAIQFTNVVIFYSYYQMVQSLVKNLKEIVLWESFEVTLVHRWAGLLFVLLLMPPNEISPTFDTIMLHDDYADILNELFMWFK